MEIIKRSSGDRYREKIHLENGKTVTKTFRRKTDAQRWKAMMITKKVHGELTGISAIEQISFFELAEKWLQECVDHVHSPKTIEGYRYVVKSKLNPLFANRRLDQIELQDCERMISEARKVGLHPKTINRQITIMRQVFAFGVSRNHILKSPINKPLHLKIPERTFNYFSETEVLSLLTENRSSEISSIIYLALHTGMRVGEVLGLCWDRVNFHSNRIEITRTMTRTGLRETTKGKRARYFPMNSNLKLFFETIRLKQSDPQLVFVKSSGESFCPDHFCQRYFKKACAVARVRKLRFHDLRHTFASHFMMKGGGLFDLQKLLGHADIKETMIYAHLSPDHLEKASGVVSFGTCFMGVSPQTAHTTLGVSNLSIVSGA